MAGEAVKPMCEIFHNIFTCTQEKGSSYLQMFQKLNTNSTIGLQLLVVSLCFLKNKSTNKHVAAFSDKHSWRQQFCLGRRRDVRMCVGVECRGWMWCTLWFWLCCIARERIRRPFGHQFLLVSKRTEATGCSVLQRCFLTTVHVLGIDGLHGNVLCSVKVLWDHGRTNKIVYLHLS